jgi:hypothetical protein
MRVLGLRALGPYGFVMFIFVSWFGSCVLRGALLFLINFYYLLKKKKKGLQNFYHFFLSKDTTLR